MRPLLALTVALSIAAPASAESLLKTDRPAFLGALRAEIDAAQIVAPVPDPSCQKPMSLRTCTADLGAQMRMILIDGARISDSQTPEQRRGELERFAAGDVGQLYQASFVITGSPGEGAARRFEELCISAARVLMGGSRARVSQDFAAALTRAANKTGTDDIGVHRVARAGAKLTISVAAGPEIECKITAPDAE